ncbi:hypothetical protein CO172_02685 [Candidatus Uhrbacteria bacterium CG_4_9_14_3_um_filter_36_7]|uniref:Ribulose-phosphate 3-epimerase n=1 Tax=Candidatus Uhrbacteria bacterium CG_4_9_14_3_um_filter_36_7 TaxID=1975033 RepID=A0A2M7XH52_9BACT|nr:MAG: hypothetical protein CO172_02685 [Candidatus Uhrbacteria bacterium CG_4_9_14_3_um_filter_36_7]
MNEIIPTILVDSQRDFEQQLRIVEPYVSTVQVDILDGSCYSVTNWHDPVAVGAIQTPVQFELHLMVENPLPIITEWKKYVPNTIRAIIHAELDRPLPAIMQYIKEHLQLEAGVALNPETPLSESHRVLHEADMVLLLGVHPGASGQPFHGDSIFEKIKRLHAHLPELPLGVDGGITKENIEKIKEAGASRFCVGSSIFHEKDSVEALKALQKIIGVL